MSTAKARNHMFYLSVSHNSCAVRLISPAAAHSKLVTLLSYMHTRQHSVEILQHNTGAPIQRLPLIYLHFDTFSEIKSLYVYIGKTKTKKRSGLSLLSLVQGESS